MKGTVDGVSMDFYAREYEKEREEAFFEWVMLDNKICALRGSDPRLVNMNEVGDQLKRIGRANDFIVVDYSEQQHKFFGWPEFPKFLMKTPDFIMTNHKVTYLVDAKGIKADGHYAHIRKDVFDLEGYPSWSKLLSLKVFFYAWAKKDEPRYYCMMRWKDLQSLRDRSNWETIEVDEDRKLMYKIPKTDLTWTLDNYK